jgi:hypothetical protein
MPQHSQTRTAACRCPGKPVDLFTVPAKPG